MADNIKYVSLENLQRFKENLADVAISGAEVGNKYIDFTVNALDADETQIADATNGLNLEVIQEDGLVTGYFRFYRNNYK